MDRRTFSAAVCAGAMWQALPLQAQTREARVAWVTLTRADPRSAFLETFRVRLRELGRVEGRDLTIDLWGADASGARLKELVPQVVASGPDLIVATGGPTVRYFTEVPVPQPVAFSSSADPVVGGLVKSMAQPGVNRTGVTFFSLDLAPKRLALMKELLPGMKQVAIVGWPPHAGETLELQVAAETAARLGLGHSYHGVTSGDELDAALQAIERARADAVLVFAGTIASQFPDRFAAFSQRTRRPTVSAWEAFAEAGNVMS
ncbi:MAG: ABC transporter substrate-binding protein [Burkholderiales bacterium]|nr:ABC transporter substrate-binding protein [Burkholderiales bacterium]